MSELIDQYNTTIQKEINDIKTLLSQYNANPDNPTSSKIRVKIQNVKHTIKSLKLEARTIKLKNKKEDAQFKEKIKHDINLFEIEIESLEKKALFNGATSSITNNAHKVLSLSDKGIESNGDAINEIKQIQSDTNASLDKTIEILQNTEEVGLMTLEELRNQGRQLNGINKDVDVLDNNVKKGNKALNRLRRWQFMGRFRDKK